MNDLIQSLKKNHIELRMILAADTEGVIGHNNDLVFKGNTDDMALFRECTMNQAVLMGHNTFRSLGKEPLLNRVNVVLTHDPQGALREFAAVNQHPYGRPDKCDNCFLESYISKETMIVFAQARDVHHYIRVTGKSTLWVIGGSSLYDQLWDACPVKFITQYYCSIDEMIASDAFRTDKGNRLDANKLIRIPDYKAKLEKLDPLEEIRQGDWKDGDGHLIGWKIFKSNQTYTKTRKPLEPPMQVFKKPTRPTRRTRPAI